MSGPRPLPQQGLCFAQRSPHTYGTAKMGAGSRATSPTHPGSTAWVPVATEPCACQARLGSAVDPTGLIGHREDGEGLLLLPPPPPRPQHLLDARPTLPPLQLLSVSTAPLYYAASDLTQLTSPERHQAASMVLTINPCSPSPSSLQPLPAPPHLPAGWGLTGANQRRSTGRWPWFCPQ